MTVRELQDMLEALPGDAVVLISNGALEAQYKIDGASSGIACSYDALESGSDDSIPRVAAVLLSTEDDAFCFATTEDEMDEIEVSYK